jgi:autotransporter-associated beta strand protein
MSLHHITPSSSRFGISRRWQRHAGSLLICGLALLGSTTNADAAMRNWKAFTVDNLWSNPANWEEGVAPVDGDDLRFPVPGGGGPVTVVNDIAGLEVHTLVTNGNFTITGQPFTLTNSLFGSGSVVYDVHITMVGDQIWTLHSYNITLNGGLTLGGALTSVSGIFAPGTLRMTGVLSGNGSVTVTGTNILELPNANTYTGPTFVNGGGIKIGHPNSLGVGDGTMGNGTILGGGRLEFTVPVTLDDELIEARGGGGGIYSAEAVTLTGPIHLKAEQTVATVTAGLHIAGPLEFAGGFSTSPTNPFNFAQLVCPGGILDLTGAELQLALPEGFHPALGQALTIVDVWNNTPITGTFTGLPEGATLTAGSAKFVISYTGGPGGTGTGNDVVLTVVGVDMLYYLSEGATGSFFSTDILLANPHPTAAPVTVTFLKSGGGTPVVVTENLPAWSHKTLRVNDVAGMQDTSFSTIVRSDDAVQIVVERTMWWDQTGYGSHTEKATEGPSKTWFFAEGTQGFFSTYVLLTNPHPDANSATVQYLVEGALPIVRTYPLDPESRFTIDAGADQELRNKTFGMTVTFDQPGTAERAMYFGTSPLWKGGHESAGVTAPSTSWFLAEGATGTFFETFVLLANPNAIDVRATVRFLPTGGNPVNKEKVIPANGRLTLNIEQEDPSLASAPVATTVSSLLPIIVERSQYWPDPAPQWYEAHNSFGVTQLAKKWGLAEGRVGGANNAQTYILLASPNGSATVKVTFLRENAVPVQKTFNLGFDSRFNIAVGGAQVPEITNERFGVLIESSEPIAVERAVYWDAGGVTWAAGSNATATRLHY